MSSSVWGPGRVRPRHWPSFPQLEGGNPGAGTQSPWAHTTLQPGPPDCHPQPVAFAWVPISQSGKSIISADNPACTSPVMTHLRTHPSLSTSQPCILFPSLNVLNPSHLRAFPHAGPLLESSSALQAESLSMEN